MSQEEEKDPGLFYGEWFWCGGEDQRSWGFNLSLGSLHHGGRIEHNFETPLTFPVRTTDGHNRISLRGPVALLSLGLISIIDGNTGREEERGVYQSPYRFLLLAPNSTVKYRLGDRWQLALGMTTDYWLYRNHSGERGIEITPYVGFSAYGFPGVHRGYFLLAVGYTSFLSFDGESRSPGLCLTVKLAGFPLD